MVLTKGEDSGGPNNRILTMRQHSPAADRALNAFSSIRRDISHAVRSLAKESDVLAGLRRLARHWHRRGRRARDLRSRDHAPARGIDTNGLTEVLVLPLGPLRAKAGEWALERWSYRTIRRCVTPMSA